MNNVDVCNVLENKKVPRILSCGNPLALCWLAQCPLDADPQKSPNHDPLTAVGKSKADIHLHQWHMLSINILAVLLLYGRIPLAMAFQLFWRKQKPGCCIAVAQGETSISHSLPGLYLEPTNHLPWMMSPPRPKTIEYSWGANSSCAVQL